MHEIQQFKLTNGDEILCETLEWNDDKNEVFIKNVMTIVHVYVEEERYAVFRPYLNYAEQDSHVMALNSQHITIVSQPSELLVSQYRSSILDMHKMYHEREQEFLNRQIQTLEQITDVIKARQIEQFNQSLDSSSSNVISFPFGSDDKIH